MTASDSTTAQPEQLLLDVRQKLYPRSVSGVFARWRWTTVFLTQAVFYGVPWLWWNDRQAVLFDLGARKFYVFGLVLNPQDFIYLTGLLVVSALSLFLFTTIAGRLWCGYACPQTVYTELFLWIERRVEGDRARRMRLDAGPWTRNKWQRKVLKHALWLMLAFWTGFTFVGYFVPIREQLGQLMQVSLNSWQLFWIGFYAFATYGNAGFMREQVCKYMCPYARFQGVMFDRDTLVITYDEARGEPRGSRSRQADPRALSLGDCVDCQLCVQVCPTGIDIRDGQQYECIGCAACIDACNQVMHRLQYAPGLIRYDTLNGVQHGWGWTQRLKRLMRIRVLVYVIALLAACTVLFTSLLARVPLVVDVMRDRGVLSRVVDEGLVENVYRLNLTNSTEQRRNYVISVGGIDGVLVASERQVRVDAASQRQVAVRVRANPQAGVSGMKPIWFDVEATDDPAIRRRAAATFHVPPRH